MWAILQPALRREVTADGKTPHGFRYSLEILLIAALGFLPKDEILYALLICASILVFTIAGIAVIETLNSRGAGRTATGVIPSIKTPDTKLLNQLVDGALETVCRAVSIPETPESARLRVFIFRKDGTQLTCSHYWAPNPVRELVNRLHFEINSKIAEDVAVVQAARDEKITRTKVKPLPAHMKRVTGEVSDELTFVLAAPLQLPMCETFSQQRRVRALFRKSLCPNAFKASRDIIVRTENWSEALKFYGSVLGLPITDQSETIVGFETGSFCLYVEQGKEHGPVFDFLVSDIQAAKRTLVAAGCTVIEENPKIPCCYVGDPYGVVFNIGQSSAEK